MKSFGSLGLALAFALIGCAGEADAPLTFEEFTDQAYQEPDTGIYIINGDEGFETAQLQDVYARYLESWNLAHRGGDVAATELPSIVNTVNGQDDKWSASTAQNLTYCIDQAGFGSRYNTVVSAMNNAASAWEGAARVNFVHVSSLDGNCSSRTSGVVFNVRQVRSSQYLASAFFPSTSRRGRELKISTSSFGNISPWTLTGVLRHELGHTIGLRHEHTRPEAGVCFENNSWRALTAYDSSSVMHYPQCNGTQTGDLVLTNLDRTGASSLYP